ncbi:hypothetical protein OH797_30905 [Streptomyces anulatus]|uniref:hypothetical protein n=1 Tax=Streptomyces anulatus TaxID=1892 RepID=UPI0037F5FAD6|nr:hypothetical protein OG865_31920 [Streptomyces anulatus]
MAMVETIFAAVSGLCGASLGAASTLLVQRARRRDDAAAASLAAERSAQAAREAAEREASQAREAAEHERALAIQAYFREAERADAKEKAAASALTVEMLATARVAARMWLITAERAIRDLQQGHAVDPERYDEQLQAELKEFTSTLYRIATRHLGHPALGRSNRALVELLSETSQHLRDALRINVGARLPESELDDLVQDARHVFGMANAYLVDNTEAITGRRIEDVERCMPSPREH